MYIKLSHLVAQKKLAEPCKLSDCHQIAHVTNRLLCLVLWLPVSVPSALGRLYALETSSPKLPALIKVPCDKHFFFLLFQIYIYPSASVKNVLFAC